MRKQGKPELGGADEGDDDILEECPTAFGPLDEHSSWPGVVIIVSKLRSL